MKGQTLVIAAFIAAVVSLRFWFKKSWLIALGIPAVAFWLFYAWMLTGFGTKWSEALAWPYDLVTRYLSPKEPKHNFGGTATEAELAYTDYLTAGGPQSAIRLGR